jgi:probable addiction module antidote protein
LLFDEYAETGDATTLFASLRLVGQIKGVTAITDASGLSQKGVQKALSENGNPQFGSVNAIMNAMGYRLTPQKLSQAPISL